MSLSASPISVLANTFPASCGSPQKEDLSPPLKTVSPHVSGNEKNRNTIQVFYQKTLTCFQQSKQWSLLPKMAYCELQLGETEKSAQSWYRYVTAVRSLANSSRLTPPQILIPNSEKIFAVNYLLEAGNGAGQTNPRHEIRILSSGLDLFGSMALLSARAIAHEKLEEWEDAFGDICAMKQWVLYHPHFSDDLDFSALKTLAGYYRDIGEFAKAAECFYQLQKAPNQNREESEHLKEELCIIEKEKEKVAEPLRSKTPFSEAYYSALAWKCQGQFLAASIEMNNAKKFAATFDQRKKCKRVELALSRENESPVLASPRPQRKICLEQFLDP